MNNRPYTNNEIQEKISAAAKNLSDADLDKLCKKDHSKVMFDINMPLFLRVPEHFTDAEKSAAVKDKKDQDRWTWEYEFKRNGFIYAISTQWYARNDEYVQRWLQKVQ
ncbi:hypothetical protein LX77_00673 [Gelidibacter algens]|jgi:hypothetical protein|uniref:Uncharacterized protein n=1 Tax=Gelidibacter algens TaxID=49280 RepID=A0A1A7R5Y3_9FLAO|nr:hypothetical protein [Gelidibacter algens]OBX26884.1 hypothetical protein A9996_02105 [Gelidibacter algens]RAJ26425.1 hypothetical protein LX77_00673 [Gelidibacter algens]